MAYVSQEVITKARTALKALNKEYGVKATLSGKNNSALKLTIAEGSIDFIDNYCNMITEKDTLHNLNDVIKHIKEDKYIQVNHYYLDSAFDGKALEYLEKAKVIMYVDHWDKSDIQSDYFNCAYYVRIDIGRWNKPYQFQN
jgi:hypothetical protein